MPISLLIVSEIAPGELHIHILYWKDASHNRLRLLYWKDASHNTLGYSIEGMHLLYIQLLY